MTLVSLNTVCILGFLFCLKQGQGFKPSVAWGCSAVPLDTFLSLAIFLKNKNKNSLFKYIYAHKNDTRYIFEKVDREVIPIKGPLTEL